MLRGLFEFVFFKILPKKKKKVECALAKLACQLIIATVNKKAVEQADRLIKDVLTMHLDSDCCL